MKTTRRVGLALVHYPVLDKSGAIVTTSITNLDVHDIARSAFTFGVGPYFLVHPITAQRDLVVAVKRHWTEGSGARRIPDRQPPLSQVELAASLEEAKSAFSSDCETWVTSAKPLPGAVDHNLARGRLQEPGPDVLLVFGTGWGLANSVVDAASVRLAPIVSPRLDGYNHLSVRAAAAIFLDRLLGGLP